MSGWWLACVLDRLHSPLWRAVDASQTTYLELSAQRTGAHTFYEITVSGAEVTVRYGPIGDRVASAGYHDDCPTR